MIVCHEIAYHAEIPVLPGDGIGPEVMDATRRVLDWYRQEPQLRLPCRGSAGRRHRLSRRPAVADPDETIEKARRADAVLLGAVGGPQWDKLPFAQKPERGLLRLRKDLELFANLRPALVFDALKEASTLKPEMVSGLDILIVRELTGGVYFGEPQGNQTLPDGQKRARRHPGLHHPRDRPHRRVAFELARLRGNKVASAEKSNVMVTGVLWREVVTEVHKARIPGRRASAMCWPTIAPCSWCAIPSSST